MQRSSDAPPLLGEAGFPAALAAPFASAAAASGSSAAATAVPPPPVLRELIQIARLRHTRGGAEIELRLNERALSGITLRIRALGGGNIALEAFAPRGAGFGDAELQAIQDALGEQALNVTELEVHSA